MTETQHPDFHVGDRARLLHGSTMDARRWWTVEAVDARFVILTRQADFKPRGTNTYTIIDWKRSVRGPSNLIGQGWNVDEPGGCSALLRALNAFVELTARLEALPAGTLISPGEPTVEVSYRNNVPIGFAEREIGEPMGTFTAAWNAGDTAAAR